MDYFCYFFLVLLYVHARLFVDALWSPAGKGLTSWLSFVMSNCDVVILGQVCCLIVSMPDLCPLTFMSYDSLYEESPFLCFITVSNSFGCFPVMIHCIS